MKKTTFIFFFLLMVVLVRAQDETMNLEKYWHYRYRLIHNFMVVGENPGMSLPEDAALCYDTTTLFCKLKN